MKNKKSILKSLSIGLATIVTIIIFAYAFQVTNVNFETTRSTVRVTQLTRVLRALAKPDIITYDKTELNIEAPFYLPCPEGVLIEKPVIDQREPYISTNVLCASPKEMVTVEGFNLPPESSGPINFVTASGVSKQMGNFDTNSDGYFSQVVEIPTRQPVAEAQTIRITVRTQYGPPKFTGTAKATGNKIVETVFIALLATTIGTLLSIPISFIAARNLMKDATSTPTGMALAILGWPAGIWIGLKFTRWIMDLLIPITDNTLFSFIGSILLIGIIIYLFKSNVSTEDIKQLKSKTKIIRMMNLVLASILSVIALILLGNITRTLGTFLIPPLKGFGFLGNALYLAGDITVLLTPGIVALVTGAIFANILAKFGQSMNDSLSEKLLKLVNVLFTTLAGAVLFAIVGAGINWFYQINDPTKILYIPLAIGGFLGLILGLIASPKQPLPTGLIIYFITRTILNATRSIEPLVMAIVAVIWVGIGPFAGSLALALHTVASLSKLYSEQVESIASGPLEAIHATGANRLQTIVYAVIPQIVPPYISFTMYRWDINVRMSTIIGFVGGGGIGFLLQQNINLLDYRAASVQMVAIAIVVASMDYVSSTIREKIV